MKLKSLLLILSLPFSTSVFAGLHERTSTANEVEAITTAYDLYVKHFIESDYEGIASVMQLPLIQKADKTLIAVTREEVISKGQAVYFLNNGKGVWKIFYMQFFIK